jgi:type II secretory pathway pseudopilin PulG
METRKLIAYLLILGIVAAIAVARIVTLRARRRERRQAARPIEILGDTHER